MSTQTKIISRLNTVTKPFIKKNTNIENPLEDKPNKKGILKHQPLTPLSVKNPSNCSNEELRSIRERLEHFVSNNLKDKELLLIVNKYKEILSTKLDENSFEKYMDPITTVPYNGSHCKKITISPYNQF